MDEPYITVQAGRFMDLLDTEAFVFILKDLGIEEWGGFPSAVEAFLEAEGTSFDFFDR
jgi:hypothetical protein